MTCKTQHRGFTLIETLVAITILITAIAGPLTIAYKGYSAAKVAKDQITAFFLAQDALEYIRFARDTNLLSGGNWITGGSGGIDLSNCQSANGCAIDSLSATVDSGSSILKYNSNTGSYNTSGTVIPAFTRVITITSGTTEVIVSATVSWTGENGVSRSVNLFESLFNWP